MPLLAQTTISQDIVPAVTTSTTSSLTSFSTSSANLVLTTIDKVQTLDFNLVAKYCLGILIFIWLVMTIWVFLDARRRYVHWYTALVITMLCGIPGIGFAFLLLYAIMRPELTIKEWEIVHANYAKFDLYSYGRLDKALPMPDPVEQKDIKKDREKEELQLKQDTAEKENSELANAEELKKLEAESNEVQELKNDVEEIAEQVKKLNESINESSLEAKIDIVEQRIADEDDAIDVEVSSDTLPADAHTAESLNDSEKQGSDSLEEVLDVETLSQDIVGIELPREQSEVETKDGEFEEDKLQADSEKAKDAATQKLSMWQRLKNLVSFE